MARSPSKVRLRLPRPSRKWGSAPPFLMMISGLRVLVDGDEEDPGLPVEYVHGSVPGVDVRVQDHHPLEAVVLQEVLGADRHVVEDAEPPAVAPPSVMEASPHPLGGLRLPIHDQFPSLHGSPGYEPGRLDDAWLQGSVPREREEQGLAPLRFLDVLHRMDEAQNVIIGGFGFHEFDSGV